MSKEITLSQSQKADLISQVLNVPALASSAKSITGRYTDGESRDFLDDVVADIGPDVMGDISGATLGVVDQYLEANGIDKEAFWDDYYASREEGEEQGDIVDHEAPADAAPENAPRLSKQDRLEVVSTAVVAATLNRGREISAPLENVKMHSFSILAQAPGARMMARNIFGLFPCFRGLGSTAVDQMDVALHIEARPGQNAPEVNAMTHRIGANRMTGREDVQGIGRWIKGNGMSLAANRVNIPTGLQKYESNILFAVSEDETFLFVEERADLASYSYNDETGDLTVRVKPGKEVQTGEILSVIPVSGGETAAENLNRLPQITGPMELRPVVMRPNELHLVYTGDRTLEQHDVVRGNFNRVDLVPEARAFREQVKNSFDPIGTFGGRDGGGSPVDAQFVYRWPGGRKFFEQNPAAVQQLAQLMAARDTIEITMNLQEDMRRMGLLKNEKEGTTAAISSGRATEGVKVKTSASDLTPVTPPAPRVSKNMNSNKPVKLMAFFRDRGYMPRQYKVGAGKHMVLFKSKGDEFLVLSAADGRPLPSSREMTVELRDAPEDVASKSVLATISNTMSPEEIVSTMESLAPYGSSNTP